MCVLEPESVSVSLSHYCPTAASLLFGDAAAFSIMDDPPAFPAWWPFEGLDATQSYPPFLRTGVLLGFDGLRAFEAGAVAALADDDLRGALARIQRATEGSRRWTPDSGPLADFVTRSFAASGGGAAPVPSDPRAVLQASTASAAADLPRLPEFVGGFPDLAAPIDRALRRYLAARVVAAWIMFLADDLATVARYLQLCLDTVFLFEGAQPASSPPIVRWTEAIRAADLWILHHCDPDLLARNLG